MSVPDGSGIFSSNPKACGKLAKMAKNESKRQVW